MKGILDESNASHAEVLNDIKRRFREETFTRESIMEAIDFDGSSVVTIEEVNVFTDAKPQDWR